MNVLLLSVGTRNQLIRYFRQAVGKQGRVLAADCSPFAPALYEADAYFIIPRVNAPDYRERLEEICRTERVDAVLSLIDPELSGLAQNRQRLEALGTRAIVCDYEQCERCLHKDRLYRWMLEHHYPCVRSWLTLQEFITDLQAGKASFPVFVKPMAGSASDAVCRVTSREMLDALFALRSDWMIQEMMDAEEIGADVYLDLDTGKVVSVFTKKKLVMRAGETDKAVSFRDPVLTALLERFCTENGFRGPVDIDLFRGKDGQYYISEVNPRFGGGYPLAHGCGCDFPGLILQNLAGTPLSRLPDEYPEGVTMMKYSETLIR